MKYLLICLKSKRADFFGRASRREYWSYTLLMTLIMLVISILVCVCNIVSGGGSDSRDIYSFEYNSIGGGLLTILLYFVSMATTVPGLAVNIRRLHDTGHSAWWYLLNLVPVIGWIWLLVLYLTPGDSEANRYGENPKLVPHPGGMHRTDFQCFNSCITKYFVFSGTSSMQEYWSFTLLVGVIAGFAASIGGIFDLLLNTGEVKCSGVMALLVFLVMIIPGFSSTARRLRSAGFSPWLLLLDLVPVLGWIALFVLCLMPDRDPKKGVI